ncbi:MAG: DUF2189 domain-containing protein [Pseudomonadota bacterium]
MAANHVENPFEYAIERAAWAVRDLARFVVPHPERHAAQTVPDVRRITFADLRAALREGAGDVGAFRDDVLFIGIIYPIAGALLAAFAFNQNLLMMLFPLVSGFAIIGPVAATGLYEMSRRREQGEHVTWLDGLKVFSSPAIGSIIGFGAVLMTVFAVWLLVAYQIGAGALGGDAPPTFRMFLNEVLFSPASPALIAGGIGVGFLFAAFTFAIGVVTAPLLLDRDVGLRLAMETSLKVVKTNPGPMAAWAATIAGLLVLGSLPALVGLIVVVPLLGHASWRLYRKLVV